MSEDEVESTVGRRKKALLTTGGSELAPSVSDRIARLSLAKRELLKRMLIEEGAELPPSVIPQQRGEDRRFPLSFSQLRLWFLDQLTPGNPVYNIPIAVRLKGALDRSALTRALSEIMRRHESLRTTFPLRNGLPVQQIALAQAVELPVQNLRGFPTPEREKRAEQLIDAEAKHSFDLAKGPLFRAVLLELDEDVHALLLNMHHIISDGWSLGILFDELASLYGAYSKGKASPLPELSLQYADFTVWQQQWLQGDVLDSLLSYWNGVLGDNAPPLELPTDYPRPAVQTFRGAMRSLVLPTRLSTELKALSRREGVTLFMTLLAALDVLLYRCTGQREVTVGCPIAGRNRSEIEGLIGFFLNTLVLRTDLSDDLTFLDLLGRVRDTTLGAYAHQDLPFERLLEELQPDRDLSRTPLFQVFFNMLTFGGAGPEFLGLTAEMLQPLGFSTKLDLTLYAREESRGIHLDLVYNPDLFGQARIVEMLHQFRHLLSQIVVAPETRISRFSLVTPTGRKVLPNPTEELDPTWEGAVHTLFARQASSTPEHPAVEDQEGIWCYEELNRRSNQLANHLRGRGVEPQEVVAIYGHRSASLVWAVLGVLKAGAAFLILDPAYPSRRLVAALRAARPRGWLQISAAGDPPSALVEFLAETDVRCRLVLPGRLEAAADGLLSELSTDDPGVTVGADDLAYVAFTSGSTGSPKGILGRHGSLSHFLPWQRNAFDLSRTDRYSMLSGLSHDPLQRDIFTPLCLGATLTIPDPDNMLAPGWLAEWMRRERISVAHLTPAMLRLLIQAASTTGSADTEIPSLRYVFVVGDVLKRTEVSLLRKLAPSTTCINFYGSTETQRAVAYYMLPEADDMTDGSVQPNERRTEVVPVGRGIPGVQLILLNGSGDLCGVGEIGEIRVRSPHLAGGYLGDKALTDQRFTINPFTGKAGDRLYASGDLGRYLPDGNVEFAGRSDGQVKIRGFRVEPGEIESALSEHEGVRRAKVVSRELRPGEKSIIAYVAGDTELSVWPVRRFLRERLPNYMIPHQIIKLDALPLLPSGKIDLRALPEPTSSQTEREQHVPPATETEIVIAEIWRDALKVDRVNVHDNFFDLGGHSLLSVEVLSKVEQRLGVRLSPREIIRQSLKQLAATCEELLEAQPSDD